jgi:trans-2,3-dihydro-3-hydroxyanthranilate isomerase
VAAPEREGGHASFDIPRLPAQEGKPGSIEAVAAALSLSVADIGDESHRIEGWSGGVPFTFVPLRGLDAVSRCRPDLAKWDVAFGGVGRAAAFVFCKGAMDAGNDFHARMFAPRMGILEDPATGSAVAAFAGLLAPRLGDGPHRVRIEQGYEMGRPSEIELGLTVRAGALAAASISGHAIIVSEGMIEA